MSVDDRDSAEYLRQARKRIKRRAGAWMSLVVGPAILIVLALKLFERHDYPAGDLQNEPLFWIVLGLFIVVLVATLVTGSIRVLLQREPDPPPSRRQSE